MRTYITRSLCVCANDNCHPCEERSIEGLIRMTVVVAVHVRLNGVVIDENTFFFHLLCSDDIQTDDDDEEKVINTLEQL